MGKFLDDQKFTNVDYKHTDLRVTFARVREQMEKDAKAKATQEAAKVERLYVVYPGLRVTK